MCIRDRSGPALVLGAGLAGSFGLTDMVSIVAWKRGIREVGSRGYVRLSPVPFHSIAPEKPMSGNTLGTLFTVTSFGESHGPAIGCVVDGCPPGMELCEAEIQAQLDRRKPGTSRHVTQRREPDTVEILSGVFEGRTTGTPIGLLTVSYTHLDVYKRQAHTRPRFRIHSARGRYCACLLYTSRCV